jgi:O-antigen/teichoic acid export membrane protein
MAGVRSGGRRQQSTGATATTQTANAHGAAPKSLTTRLFKDAGWIALASLLASGLGVVFWAVAARQIPPAKLGVQTAVLSAILAPASIVASGIGDAFNAIAGWAAGHRRELITHAYRLALLAAVPLGLLAATGTVLVVPSVRGSVSTGAAVFAGVVLWSLFTIQDSILTTLGNTRWLAVESTFAGVAKVALLPMFVGLTLAVVWSALLPAALAVIVIAPVIARISRRSPRVPDPAAAPADAAFARGALSRLALRTTTSIALTMGALTFLPFVMTAVAGPRQGALFSLALSIVAILDLITGGVGISLVVHSSGNRDHERALVGLALKRTLPIIGIAAVLLVALAAVAFPLLNPEYIHLHAIAVIMILAATSVLRTVYLIWSSRQQARQAMGVVLRLNAVAACVAYAIVLTLGHRYGAMAGAIGLAAAQIVLSGTACVHIFGRRAEAPAAADAPASLPVSALQNPT